MPPRSIRLQLVIFYRSLNVTIAHKRSGGVIFVQRRQTEYQHECREALLTLEVVSRAGIVFRSNDNSSNFSVVRRSDILVKCWKSAKCHAEKWCCRLKSRPIRSPCSHTRSTSRMAGRGLGAF